MRNKKKKLGLLVLMLCAIVSSVAFAAYSGVLTISGTTSIQSNPFNVVFVPSEGTEAGGTVTAKVGRQEGSADTINQPSGETVTLDANATTFGPFEVTLCNPGDGVAYKFLIKNTGGEKAYLNSVEIAATDLEGAGWTSPSISEFIYSLTVDGLSPAGKFASMNGAQVIKDRSSASVGDDQWVLDPGGTWEVAVQVAWNDLSALTNKSNSNPGSDITLTMGNITLNWGSAPEST